MCQFVLKEAHQKIINTPLKELRLVDRDVKILNIQRNHQSIKNPTGSTLLLPGDEVLVYGNVKRIHEYFYVGDRKV